MDAEIIYGVTGRNYFGADLVKSIFLYNCDRNVIYSPASIHTSLPMAFFGTEGVTAQELRRGLYLDTDEDITILRIYGKYIENYLADNNMKPLAPIFKMANRMYVDQSLRIKDEFNLINRKIFKSSAGKVDFAKSAEATSNINA